MDTHGLSPRQYELARGLAGRIAASRRDLDREDRQAAEQPFHTRSKSKRNLDRAVIRGMVIGLSYLLGLPDAPDAAEDFIED